MFMLERTLDFSEKMILWKENTFVASSDLPTSIVMRVELKLPFGWHNDMDKDTWRVPCEKTFIIIKDFSAFRHFRDTLELSSKLWNVQNFESAFSAGLGKKLFFKKLLSSKKMSRDCYFQG